MHAEAVLRPSPAPDVPAACCRRLGVEGPLEGGGGLNFHSLANRRTARAELRQGGTSEAHAFDLLDLLGLLTAARADKKTCDKDDCVLVRPPSPPVFLFRHRSKQKDGIQHGIPSCRSS